MLDQELPGLGDNNGPVLNPEVIEEYTRKVQDFADAAGDWKETKEITEDAQAEKAKDFLDGARKLFKDIEDRRKVEKEPFLAGGREVDAKFATIKAILEKSANMVKPLLEDFIKRKEAAEATRKAEEARKAREEQEAAQAALRAAESRNDAAGMVEAEEASEAAQEAVKEAEQKTSVKVASATGGGKRSSLRTIRRVELKSPAMAFSHFKEHPEMKALLLKLGNAELRAAKGAEIKIPGFAIVEDRKL